MEAELTIPEIVRKPGVAFVLCIYTHAMLLGLGYSAGMFPDESASTS